MKKIIALLLVLVMVLGLVACGAKEAPKTEEKKEETSAPAQTEEKNAVAAGYWHLFRFDPRLAEEGKNPFQLDSKAPTADYKAFIESEVRYNRLSRTNPERANALFEKAAKDAADKYAKLAKMAE